MIAELDNINYVLLIQVVCLWACVGMWFILQQNWIWSMRLIYRRFDSLLTLLYTAKLLWFQLFLMHINLTVNYCFLRKQIKTCTHRSGFIHGVIHVHVPANIVTKSVQSNLGLLHFVHGHVWLHLFYCVFWKIIY